MADNYLEKKMEDYKAQAYYRDENGTHFVPKVRAEELILDEAL